MVSRVDDLNLLALPFLETRTRWRTRPCVLARALLGHANAAWKSGLITSVPDRNLTLTIRLAVALSASNVRSAQCTFSRSLVRHLAPTARTTAVKCEWLLAGINDRALHHWGHVLPLDGGPGPCRL